MKPFKRPRHADKPAPQSPDRLTGLTSETDAGKPMCWHFNMSGVAMTRSKAAGVGLACMSVRSAGKLGMEQRNAEPLSSKGVPVRSAAITKLFRAPVTSHLEPLKVHVNRFAKNQLSVHVVLLQFNSFRSESFSRISGYRRRA